MLLTGIMCGLVGLIGRLVCTGFIAQTNARVRVTNTKCTSSKHLGNGIQSSPTSKEYGGSPNTKGTSDGHLDTGLRILQSSKEYN